ncbi:MAG: radical SAM protein [Lachnospiraceae bacterium]|nr:radical SAM protein [Lachnospiraceae bacterium]
MMGTYQLRQCVWEITLACCFSCRYCGSGGGKARENELNREECLKLADELAELGCRRISMIGGEIFMRPDWKDIVERLVGNGIAVCIISNGYMIDHCLAQELKKLNIESLALSLDGPACIHDRYRQEGSFKRVKRALGVLANAGVPTSVISTLNSENEKTLEELYGFLTDYPIFAWQLQACLPMGNASRSGVDHRFDVKRVIRFVEDHADAPFALGIADNIGYYTESEGSLRGNRSGVAVYKGCQAGLTVVGIDSVGNVKGCESLYDERFFEGNVRQRSLKSIWEDPEAFSYNRKFNTDMLTGKCASCDKKSVCRGGCRSMDYFAGGKLYESPCCARNL